MPGALRAELADRERVSARSIVVAATLVFPPWAVLDRVSELALAPGFLVGRVVTEIVLLACLWLLRSPRQSPAALAFVALAAVQIDVAWMLVRVAQVEFYLLGFSLALHASGVLLSARPRWTVALVTTTWVSLGIAELTTGDPVSVRRLTAISLFMATACFVALMAHHRRWQLAIGELAARIRLEGEQLRTQELLVRLDRLSHEDSLTGLANRRRWDADLATACARI